MEGSPKKTKNSEIFAHLCIESDGDSMINFGIVFSNRKGEELDNICIDILPLVGRTPEKSKMEWWMSDPERKKEYERIMENGLNFVDAMTKFNSELERIQKEFNPEKIEWIVHPAFDWRFFKDYHEIYLKLNPTAMEIAFKYNCLYSIIDDWKLFYKDDENKYYNAKMTGVFFKQQWTNLVRTHNALDDARYQAPIYHGILRDMLEFTIKNL